MADSGSVSDCSVLGLPARYVCSCGALARSRILRVKNSSSLNIWAHDSDWDLLILPDEGALSSPRKAWAASAFRSFPDIACSISQKALTSGVDARREAQCRKPGQVAVRVGPEALGRLIPAAVSKGYDQEEPLEIQALLVCLAQLPLLVFLDTQPPQYVWKIRYEAVDKGPRVARSQECGSRRKTLQPPNASIGVLRCIHC